MKQIYFTNKAALVVCDETTGHSVSAVAYCDSAERATAIADRLKLADELIAALVDAMPHIGHEAIKTRCGKVLGAARVSPYDQDDEGFIVHHGDKNPVPGKRVVVKLRNGAQLRETPSDHFVWSHGRTSSDIVAYRIAGPAELSCNMMGTVVTGEG